MVLHHSGFLKEMIGLRVEADPQDIVAFGSLRGQSEAWVSAIEQLIANIISIQSGLRPILMKGNTVRDADRVKKAGRENLKFLAKKPKYLRKDLKSGFIRVDTDYYRPMKLIDSKLKNDNDTPESRFLRWILTRIRQTICRLKGSLRQQGGAYDLALRKHLDNLERQLCSSLNADFMTEVSDMRQLSINQILQISPSCQDIYRCYLRMMKGLD